MILRDVSPAPDDAPSRAGGDLTTPDLLAKSPGASRWCFEVVDLVRLRTPMLRLVLSVPDVADLTYAPGQDLTVVVHRRDGRTVRRRYTIRALDPDERLLTLDVYLHGRGLGSAWAESLRPGDLIEAVGPRGKMLIDEQADWHAFIGDETAIPAFEAMVEAVGDPSASAALLEVADPSRWIGSSPTTPGTSWSWLVAPVPQEARAGFLADLAARFAGWAHGHVYVAGETGMVARWREQLESSELASHPLSTKAYWRADQPNATHGEPLSTSPLL